MGEDDHGDCNHSSMRRRAVERDETRAEAAAIIRRFLETADDLPENVVAYLRGCADAFEYGAKPPLLKSYD